MHRDARPIGRIYRRFAYAAAIAVAFASCARYSTASDVGLAAFALPETQAAPAAQLLQGRREIVNEWNFTLPVTDFSRVVTMSADEAFARIRAGDPRRTPLIDGLDGAFRMRSDGRAWAIMYQTGGAEALFDALDELRSAGIEALAVSRARPLRVRSGAPPAGGLAGPAAALALSLWYLFRVAKGDLSFRAIVGSAWVPFLSAPSLGGALAAVATAAFAGEFALILARRRPRRDELLYAVLIYGPVASFAAASDPFALVPGCAAALWIAAASVKRERILSWCNACRLHGPPDFMPISRPSAARGYARGALRLIVPVALVVAAAGMAGWAQRWDRTATARIEASPGLSVEFVKLDPRLEGMSPLVAHAAYQVALTWGRLGDAAWGRFDPELLMPPPGVGTTDPKEIVRASFGTNALHKALDSGYIPSVRAAERLVPAAPYRGISLLALLAALAPAISLYIHGRLRSR